MKLLPYVSPLMYHYQQDNMDTIPQCKSVYNTKTDEFYKNIKFLLNAQKKHEILCKTTIIAIMHVVKQVLIMCIDIHTNNNYYRK